MHIRSTLALTAILGIATGAAAEPVIMNGDFNGTVGIGLAPDDWMPAQGTPDLVDANGPFNNTGVPWTLSPNGGNFVRLGGVGNEFSEGISQNVSGFVAGESYSISFYASNIGFQNAATGAWSGMDGFFEFYANGELIATSDSLSKQPSGSDPIVWTEQSIQFEASASDFLFEIRGETVGDAGQVSYMGIDGVSASIVPTPGTLSALAMLGLASTRRRR